MLAALQRRAREGEGESWEVRVSLAQTGRWLEDFAAPRDVPATVDLSVPPSDTPIGRLRHMGSAVQMSATPTHWALPATPIGQHPPIWAGEPVQTTTVLQYWVTYSIGSYSIGSGLAITHTRNRLAVPSCVPSLARTKPGALGQSCHSLGQSCAHLLVARADAELALEGAGEIRKIVETDGIGDLLDERAGLSTMMHGSFRAFAPAGGRGRSPDNSYAVPR